MLKIMNVANASCQQKKIKNGVNALYQGQRLLICIIPKAENVVNASYQRQRLL